MESRNDDPRHDQISGSCHKKQLELGDRADQAQAKGLLSRRTLMAAAVAISGAAVLTELARPALSASAWGGYSNGYVPLSAMTKINYPGVNYWSWSSNPAHGAVGGVYMEAAAAASLIALLSAYHSEVGGYLAVNEGYRSYAGQVYWRNNGTGGTPGQSNHGMGHAVDFDPSLFTRAQHAWVNANCGRFNYAILGSGVFNEFDWMHFNYTGAAGSGPVVEHQPEDNSFTIEEDGLFVRSTSAHAYVPNGWMFQIAPDGKVRPLSASQSDLAVLSGAKVFGWAGIDIYTASLQAGMWEFVPGSQTLTGYLLLADGQRVLPGTGYPAR